MLYFFRKLERCRKICRLLQSVIGTLRVNYFKTHTFIFDNFHLLWISGASTPALESAEEQGLGGPSIFS